jgi:hypothetical protein
LYAGFKRQEQVTRYEINILPVSFSLTTNQSGDVQINNDSPYEVDISGFSLVGIKKFVFAPRTIMLPGQTITLNSKQLGTTKNRLLMLYDTKSIPVASLTPSTLQKDEKILDEDEDEVGEEEVISLTPGFESAPPTPWFEASPGFGFVKPAEASEGESEFGSESDKTASPSPLPTEPASSTKPHTANVWPYLAFAGLLLVSIIGVLMAPRRHESL